MKTTLTTTIIILTTSILSILNAQITPFTQLGFNEQEPRWSRVSYDVNSDNGTTSNGIEGLFSYAVISRELITLGDGTGINFSQLNEDGAFSGLLIERIDFSNGEIIWANSYNSIVEGFEDLTVDAFINSEGNITILSYEPVEEYSFFSSIILGSVDSYLRIRTFDRNNGEILNDSNPRAQTISPHIMQSSFNRTNLMHYHSDTSYMTTEYHITRTGTNGEIEYGDVSRVVLDSNGKLLDSFIYVFDDLFVDFNNGSFAGATFDKHHLVSTDTLVVLSESNHWTAQDSSELSSTVNVAVLDKELQEYKKFTIESNGFPIPVFNTVTADENYIYINSNYATEFPTPQLFNDNNSMIITSVYDYDGNLIYMNEKEFLEKYITFGYVNNSQDRFSLYGGSQDGSKIEFIRQNQDGLTEILSTLTLKSEFINEDYILLPTDLYIIEEDKVLIRFFQRKRVNGESKGDWNTWMCFNPTDLDLVSSTINLDQIASGPLLNIYPNPIKNIINIEFKYPITGIVEIRNINGQKIIDRSLNKEKELLIETNSLTSGLYTVTIKDSSNGQLNSRVIVVNN